MNRSMFNGLFGKAFYSLSLIALVFIGSPALMAQEGATVEIAVSYTHLRAHET